MCAKCFKPCNKMKNCGRHWCYQHKCKVSAVIVHNWVLILLPRDQNQHICVIKFATNDCLVVTMIVTNPATLEIVEFVPIQVGLKHT